MYTDKNKKYIMHKYVVKHKSAKIFMTYAVGKLEAALDIRHLITLTARTYPLNFL